MGANLLFKCPVKGCEHEEGFRLGMGQEDDPTAPRCMPSETSGGASHSRRPDR
jgi:hypothetical protein